MAINSELLDILCCPISHAPLTPLTQLDIEALNERIAAGTLRYHDGSAVEAPLTEGLITADRQYAYRIDDGIPNMLPGQAIELKDKV